MKELALAAIVIMVTYVFVTGWDAERSAAEAGWAANAAAANATAAAER